MKTTGGVRLDGDKIARMGFWTPPTDENRAIRRCGGNPFQRRRNLGNITMETELLGIDRFSVAIRLAEASVFQGVGSPSGPI